MIGGCTFAEAPIRPVADACIFWRADWNPSVLAAETLPVRRGDGDAFDVRHFGSLATVLRRPGGHEHLLLSDGAHHLQIDVTAGSLLDGPVCFRYELSGFKHIEAKTLTLRRLLLLHRLGRFPRGLFPPERRARRWAMALQAYDAVQAGASHREFAAALFGEKVVKEDWCGRSDYLRLRVQRLVRTADMLVNGGYRDLLR
jgi:hypothetical protein